MATSTLDAEAIRSRYNITRTQWSELVKDDSEGPKIARRYEKFLEHVRKAIDFEFESPAFVVDEVPYLSTIQAARALGVGEFHLSNLRDRQKLIGVRHGRRSIYSRENLLEFLNTEPRHSAVTTAFVRWHQLSER